MTTQSPPWWPVTVTWASRPGIPGDRMVDAVRARTADQARQAAATNWPGAHIAVNTKETHVSDYDTTYDLAADQYANGDYDTYVGQVTGPGGAEHEVDVSASKHGSSEPIGDAYLRIVAGHLKES